MTSKESIHILTELLDSAGIKINGTNPWDITINNARFYDRVLHQPHLALGEGYMDGWWDCPAIDQFITRALQARLDEKVLGSWRIKWHILRASLFNLQSVNRAFQVGQKHYDLGNDLYQAMLDRRLNYTCAYWKNAKDLNEAQEAKLDLVCRKLGLKPGMSVLELGCGWGSFAKYAAEKYGVTVLGVTVSKEQVALGMEMCKGLPVELHLQDYRDIQGKFDRVISIGIMEHVGYKNYRTYMQVTDRCLKEGGLGFIHTIGGNFSSRLADQFSNKYIFPNGMIPSIRQLGEAMEGLFVMEDWHNIGPHYDPTLMSWHANFEAAWPDLKKNYSERFRRMWNYYLLSSAGGFRSRSQQLWQIVFTRPGTIQPDCRMV
jgi:cyclopropane-fatty-acyl-phospholipid synthase